MLMNTLRSALCLLVVVALSMHVGARGQVSATPTSAQVELTGLQRLVVSMGDNRGLRIRHVAAARNPDTTRSHDVLRYWVFVPHEGALDLEVEPAEIRAQASIVRRGSFGGEPMAMVTVDPFVLSASGERRCVDRVGIRVTWNRPLVSVSYRVPPTAGLVLNPTWAAPKVSGMKRTDHVQTDVDPAVWYEPSQPHVRVETSRDGVALVTAAEVLQTQPSLRTTPLQQLRLFARGVQQHLYVIDADNSNTLTDSDSLLFVGRHAQGDTTWLDIMDTTAVFFLTRRETGSPLRFSRRDTTLREPSIIPYIRVRERFEVDSGYYHPGSGISEDYSTFLTPMSMFEGFYWHSLNARAQQSTTLQVPFTPAPGETFTVSSDVVSSSDVRTMDRDHGIDVRVNGGVSQRVEGDGFQRYLISTLLDGSTAPAVLQTLRIYASGVPGATERPEWFSEVLVDAVEVEGAASPVLHDGAIRGVVTVPDGGGRLMLSNVPSRHVVVLDTSLRTVYTSGEVSPEVTIRTGASRSNPSWIDQEPVSSWNICLAANDRVHAWSEVSGIAISVEGPTISSVRIMQSADSAADVLATAPADAVVSIVLAGVIPNQRLIQQLSQRKTAITAGDTLFTWTGRADSTVYIAKSVGSSIGSVVSVQAPWSSYSSTTVDIPARGDHYLVLGAGTGIERARVRPAQLNNLRGGRDTLAQSDVIVLAHSSVRASAERWAAYRSAASNVTTRVVDVESIFDEYDAGRHSPESMRAFLADVWNASSTKRFTHAVLFGSASWDVRGVLGGGGRAVRPDLVPTYGRPSSDYWFGLLDDPNDVAIPELIVARFPVLNDAEADAIIDKVMAHDTVAYSPADRTALYVGGGETEDEGLCQIYQDLLNDIFYTGVRYTDVPLCLDTLTVCKSLNNTPGLDIRRHLASGVGLMNYIGHGGTEVFDIEGWDPSVLSNTRYPVLATFSCLTGAFSNPTALCRNGQYLIEPSRGVVAAMGATGWQYIFVIGQLHIDQHEVLRTTSIRDIGRLMYAMKRGFGEMGQQFSTNAVLQFNLLGDPFTRVRIDTVPDVSITTDRVVVTSPSGSRQLSEDDRQANVAVRVWNEGIGTTQPLVVRVRRTYRGITDSSTITLADGICRDALISFVLDIVEKVGEHTIEVELDPDRTYGDQRENNLVRTSLQVFARSLLVLEPSDYQSLRPTNLRVRMIDVVSSAQQPMTPNVCVSRTRDTANALYTSSLQEFTRTGSVIDWVPPGSAFVQLTGDVWIAAWGVDQSGRATTLTWVAVHLDSAAPDGHWSHNVSPIQMVFSADSVVLDERSQTLVPSSFERSIYVRSNGRMTSDPDRDPILEVRLGDSLIVRSAFRTGLNIMTLRPSDTVPYRIRRFDTSPTPGPLTSHNGFARECITFLRDSISDRDRVIVAACDESFTRFISDSLLDELQFELSRLGALRADSLSIASSYAFVGSRTNSTGLPLERWSGEADRSVTIDTLIRVMHAHVQVTSPVIGPVRNWNMIDPQIQGDVQSLVVGIRGDLTEVILDTLGRLAPADIPEDVLALKFRWTLRDGDTAPQIGPLRVNATPLPQWIIEPTAMTIDPQGAIRGDTTLMRVRVRNARSTEPTPPSLLQFDVVDASTMIPKPYAAQVIPEIAQDQDVVIDVPLATAQLPSASIARATLVIDQPLRQRFAVRDRCEETIQLSSDTLPPSIEVVVQGRRVSDGDQVPSLAAFEIRIGDNARLPMNDPEKIVVFVNGIRVRPTTTTGYEFLATDAVQQLYPGTNLRAIVRFTFPMEDGENLLIVRATDAFQNSDTLELSLYPVTELVISGTTVFPNPTSGIATIRADVIANDTELDGVLTIGDAQGRLVRTLTAPVSASSVDIRWDGKTEQNESCSSGVYVWRLHLMTPSRSVLKTVSGTLLILR